MKAAALAALIVLAPTALAAEGLALIVGNEDYDGLADVRRGDEVAGAAPRLTQSGLETVVLREATREELQAAFETFGDGVSDAEQLLVVLSGRFVHSATETYFLPVDTDAPALSELSGAALPLSPVLAYLAATPGNAILALATDDTTGRYGAHLDLGPGDLNLPQGVTLIRGEPRALARFVGGTLADPGRAFAPAAANAGLSVSGFLARGQSFLPEVVTEPVPVAPAPVEDDRLRDLLAWREADRANTADGYRAYVETFPQGQFVRMAENRLAALTDTPEARSERDEQSLDLSRDQRREIQRDLSILDYNTRGIDGIFGQGTRNAIADWQRANNLPATGYLTQDQITRLDAQAERRAAELQAEAERRLQEQLARDTAFWEETGAKGDEAGYRAYLDRFPDGEYAEIARDRLEEIESAKRAETDARDRQLWDEARSDDTVQSYRDYLTLAPNGAFRDEAAERIAELERAAQEAASTNRAAREEEALNLSQSTRRGIEGRLEALGFRPGPVDGVFDERTRRAIRRYQASRQLPETGYLSEAVVVQLLADSVRSIFR